MNAHRSLRRTDIRHRSPSQIALMVASEFSRATSRCRHRDNVLNCYARAQELLGILETILLSEKSTTLLAPLYKRCSSHALISDALLSPEVVRTTASALAEAFQAAAEGLQTELIYTRH